MSAILSQHMLIPLVASPFVCSFLGLLIERLPSGQAVVLGRSRCQSCGTVLGPRDLLPLLSWAATGGRCRHCGTTLGWFHPGIELAAVAVALWSLLAVPGWLGWATCALGWTLLAMSEIDRRHMILPDALTLPLIPAGIALAALSPAGGAADHLIGAAVGAASLGAIAWIYQRLRGNEGLGLGDVKLFAAAGAWVSWQGLPSVMLIGAASGLAVTCLISRANPGLGARAPVAFGPYLSLGLWITWLHGPLLLS